MVNNFQPFKLFLAFGVVIFVSFCSSFSFAQRMSPCGWSITRDDYCHDATSGSALVSSSLNTLFWNGSTWVPAINVPCNRADTIWGLGGLRRTPPYPWYQLYENGACWISRNANGKSGGTPDTIWFRHRFRTPSTLSCLRLKIEFFVEDTVFIYRNTTGTFPPSSAMLLGSGGYFDLANYVTLETTGGVDVILDFCVVSTRPNFIGVIYGIKCDTCYSDCGWPIQRDDYCHDGYTKIRLVSYGTNPGITMWNGSTWIPAVNIPNIISRPRWGPPNYPFDVLFSNGACWLSDNSNGIVTSNPQTIYFRHKFYLPESCKHYKLTIEFNVDDSLAIFYNYPFNSAPESGIFVGSGSGFGNSLSSVSFVVQGGEVVLDFKVISTSRPYIGVIYGIKCQEFKICDSLTVREIRIPRPLQNYNCCFEISIINPFSSSIPLNVVRFILAGSNCISANGPTGWTLTSSLPSSFVNFSGVYLQPGSNVFTLCFDRNPTFTLYLLWSVYNPFTQKWDTCDCKYPFRLVCYQGNCCDSFKVFVKTKVQQIDHNHLLVTNSFSHILPNPNLIRVLTYLAYAKRNYISPQTIFDIRCAWSTYGIPPMWVSQPPSSPPNTMLGRSLVHLNRGLEGIWGAHQSQLGFSKELIWGDLDLKNITDYGNINGYIIRQLIRITPAPWTFPPVPTIYKFGIRYMFTDTTCCTCDTLLEFSIRVYPRLRDYEELIVINNDNRGNFSLFHHRPIDVYDSSFIKCGFDFYPDTSDVSIIQIKSKRDGKTYTPDKTGKCKVPMLMQPGDTASFEITFSNPNKIYKIPCRITEYYLVDNDTIPIDNKIVAVYKVKGDEIAKYEEGKPKNPQIIALLLRNNNIRKDGISHILIKPKNREKILAVGSDAINMKAQLGIFNLMDSPSPKEIVILPESFKDAIISELKPNEEIKPIYLAFVNPANQPAEFIFETYNMEYELISDGELTIPLGVVRENNETELIRNLTISPNPASDNVSISFFADDYLNDVSIKVYDISGNLVDIILKDVIIPMGANIISYSTSTLPSGKYIVSFTYRGYELTEGFIILK